VLIQELHVLHGSEPAQRAVHILTVILAEPPADLDERLSDLPVPDAWLSRATILRTNSEAAGHEHCPNTHE
jgi:hypothetical protein